MRVEVEVVGQVSDEVVDACRRLLPQLSGTARPLGAEDLARVAGHQAVTLLVARGPEGIVGMLCLVTFPLPPGCGRGSRTSSSTRPPGARGSPARSRWPPSTWLTSTVLAAST
jgi:hypothetical protein